MARTIRIGYEAYLEGRVLELASKPGREALAEEWKAIRRGWYLGGETFGQRMLHWVDAALRKNRSASFSGDAKRAHGEAEAERMLAQGLAALELKASQLPNQPKGTPAKQVLAWWLCHHTTVRRRWVSERLAMGDESRVTRAIRCVKGSGDPALERLKRRLQKAAGAKMRGEG